MLAAILTNPTARLLAGLLFFTGLAWLFRRLGRPLRGALFPLLGLASLALFVLLPISQWLALAAMALAMLWAARRPANAEPYQPAMARIEGGGVKRGLTPPEAAVLLGRPLQVTLALVLFEMLRKGFLQQTNGAPFTVEAAEAMRTHGLTLSADQRGEKRRRAAQAVPAPLHKYEEAFLEIIEANPGAPAHEIDYGIAIQPLVRYVAGRVGGYDLGETQDYYALIIERAPKEARSDGVLTFERQKVFDRNFGWVLLGEDFRAVLDQEDYSYLPVWMRDGKPEMKGQTFAQWAESVIASMEGAVAEEEVQLGLERETDLVTATMMNEIARATFYG